MGKQQEGNGTFATLTASPSLLNDESTVLGKHWTLLPFARHFLILGKKKKKKEKTKTKVIAIKPNPRLAISCNSENKMWGQQSASGVILVIQYIFLLLNEHSRKQLLNDPGAQVNGVIMTANQSHIENVVH